MQNKPLMFAVVVIAVVAAGLLAMPALSEHVYAGNFVSESKNKGQQGEESSHGKRQGHGGTNCPKCVIDV